MSPSSLTRLLREKASELGFDLVGAIPVSRSKTIDIYNSWLKKGYAGSMSYLERHADLKEDPRRLGKDPQSCQAVRVVWQDAPNQGGHLVSQIQDDLRIQFVPTVAGFGHEESIRRRRLFRHGWHEETLYIRGSSQGIR